MRNSAVSLQGWQRRRDGSRGGSSSKCLVRCRLRLLQLLQLLLQVRLPCGRLILLLLQGVLRGCQLLLRIGR